jgi:peptidoglycan/LPS O-acetylase OafA/YrhL
MPSHPQAPASSIVDQHLPALDGLRGIAILLVMVNHFTLYGVMRPDSVVDKVFYATATSGWCGVDLFFVLSGFLITGILLDTRQSEHYFRNFYMRRALRIFPLYYLALAVFFVIVPHLGATGNPMLSSPIEDQSWYWTYLINIQIGLEGWPSNPLLAHFWSLAVEEQFYLIWPLLVFWLGRRQILTVCVGLIVCTAIVRVGLRWMDLPTAAYVLTPARMDSLAVGSMLAALARSPGAWAILTRYASPAVLVFGTTLLFAFIVSRGLRAEGALMQTAGYPLLAFLSASIMVIALSAPAGSVVSALLTHPFLTFTGRISYGLYVVHHPITLYLQPGVTWIRQMPEVLGSQIPRQWLFWVMAGSFSFAVAGLLWRFYESPLLRLKRLFPYRQPAKPGMPTPGTDVG